MVLKNLLLYTNDFLALFVMKLTIITVISIQIYALIKVKSLKKKYYIFLFIKILEIIFFKYEIFLYVFSIIYYWSGIKYFIGNKRKKYRYKRNNIGNNYFFYSFFNNYFWNNIFNTIEFYL